MRLDSRFAGSKLTVRNDCQIGNWSAVKRISLSGECSVSALSRRRFQPLKGFQTTERLFSGYGYLKTIRSLPVTSELVPLGVAQAGLGFLAVNVNTQPWHRKSGGRRSEYGRKRPAYEPSNEAHVRLNAKAGQTPADQWGDIGQKNPLMHNKP